MNGASTKEFDESDFSIFLTMTIEGSNTHCSYFHCSSDGIEKSMKSLLSHQRYWGLAKNSGSESPENIPILMSDFKCITASRFLQIKVLQIQLELNA